MALQVIATLQRGAAVDEASEEMQKVIQKVRKTGKPGEMTIKLKFRPNPDGETIGVEYDVTGKMPKLDKKTTNFYDTEDGALLRDNPNQVEMFAAQTVEGGQMTSKPVMKVPTLPVSEPFEYVNADAVQAAAAVNE